MLWGICLWCKWQRCARDVHGHGQSAGGFVEFGLIEGAPAGACDFFEDIRGSSGHGIGALIRCTTCCRPSGDNITAGRNEGACTVGGDAINAEAPGVNFAGGAPADEVGTPVANDREGR